MHRTTGIILGLALLLGLAAATQAETRRGDAGANTFTGTPHRDSYWGYAGNDLLSGRGSRDHLNGGRGVDAVRGGRGSDYVYGGRGNDRLRAARGADHLYGGRGNDRLFAFGADGRVDVVDCGAGANDFARVHTGDKTAHCETVERVG
jgi:Ca2+-binding RTX toxin-like protein